MFKLAPGATIGADGTAAINDETGLWLLNCDICRIVATGDADDEAVGDGWRYPTNRLADLDLDDRDLLGLIGWHLTDHGPDEPRQFTVVCGKCARAAGVDVLKTRLQEAVEAAEKADAEIKQLVGYQRLWADEFGRLRGHRKVLAWACAAAAAVAIAAIAAWGGGL